MNKCKIENCEKIEHCRDWCNMHYKLWLRNGDPKNRIYTKQGKNCEIEDCNNETMSKNLCTKHYERKKNYGDPYYTGTQYSYCLIKNCNKSSYCKSLCQKHYKRMIRNGSPEKTKRDVEDRHVYIAEANKYYKIGVSQNFKSIKNGLSRFCPFNSKIIYSEKFGELSYDVESTLHSLFDDYNKRGEWFELPDKIINDIKNCDSLIDKWEEVFRGLI